MTKKIFGANQFGRNEAEIDQHTIDEQVPPAYGLFATEYGHLNKELVLSIAQGHETWGNFARHLKACSQCQEEVADHREQFMLAEAARRAQPVNLSPDKKRVNKMGRSNSAYLDAIGRIK